MNGPDDLRYSRDHEWARLEDGKVRVGIAIEPADEAEYRALLAADAYRQLIRST